MIPSPARRERPPLPRYVKASVAWHGAAAVATVADPLLWPWAIGAVALNHAVITLGGLWPRSRWLGPNLVRLPAAARARREVALTIDDGPDPEVTPRVLDALDALGLKATFFCIAARARAHPALLREIAARGHSVQNHSLDHAVWFSTFGFAALEREIAGSQAAFQDILGETPRYFRAPAGLRNPFLPIVLARHGLSLVSWTRRGFDTVRGDAPRVLASLTERLAAGDILLLHDGHAARDATGEPVLLGVLPALARAIEGAGLVTATLPAALRDTVPAGGADARAATAVAEPSSSRRAAAQSARTPDADVAFRALVDRASEPYRHAGRFAWHFARGKLSRDPVFRHLLEAGGIPPGARVVDIGCGQGLLASLLQCAGIAAREGLWPAGWAAAPAGARITGIDLMPKDIARAGDAFAAPPDPAAPRPSFVCGDMRTTPFPPCDAVVLLDVLHYVTVAEQDRVLERIHDALSPHGGRLLLRIGDQGAGLGFAVSQWVDRVVTGIRGHRVPPTFGRPLAAWQARLGALGFAVETRPMHEGTPFANILLVGTLPAATGRRRRMTAPTTTPDRADPA